MHDWNFDSKKMYIGEMVYCTTGISIEEVFNPPVVDTDRRSSLFSDWDFDCEKRLSKK